MLVSPVTLNTVTVILSGMSGLDVYHSASAHDSSTLSAAALASGVDDADLCTSTTSWKASKTRRVCLSCLAAVSRSSASVLDSSVTSVPTLYPPCIVPRSSTARTGDMRVAGTSPSATPLR